MTELELARALAARDPRAAMHAWTMYAPLVRRLLYRFFGATGDQQDLSQEVFLRFFARIDELKNPEALRNFLIGICLGVARNEARRQKFRRIVQLTPRGDVPEMRGPDPDPDAREALRQLYRALDELSAQDRSLFVARYIEKMQMTDVASVHGLTLGTAKRRVARATERVAARLSGDPRVAGYLDGLGAEQARVEGEP